mgnify:FL=1|jgi:hypothetical protein
MELKDLAIHFEAEASAMLGMLEFLEGRGEVKRIVVSCGSGGCGSCPGCGSQKTDRTAQEEAPGITFWAIEDGDSKSSHPLNPEAS